MLLIDDPAVEKALKGNAHILSGVPRRIKAGMMLGKNTRHFIQA